MEKKHQCPYCVYICSEKRTLKIHILVCTGELHCSSGEKAVMDVLDDTWMLEYYYDSTYVVSNSSMLKWDFIIPSPKGPVFIEYDGIAHFQPVRFGNYTYVQAIKNLKKQQKG
jgi:hypothetical protein